MRLIHIEVRKGGKLVFKGEWDSLEELLGEKLPRVFGEHLSKKLLVK